MAKLEEFLSSFQIVPRDISLFEMAFTHSSVNGASGKNHFDYERLEFLGDALVGLVTSDLIYHYHQDLNQGGMSKLKAQFVKTESEASYALKMHLDEHIKVGKSLQGNINHSILEDVFESFIGAIYLDQGLDFAYRFVRSVFESDIKNGSLNRFEDPKSMLQEAIQAENKESVSYKVIKEWGKSNDKHFISAVYFESEMLGSGEGKSKKEAEFNAARDALSKLAKE